MPRTPRLLPAALVLVLAACESPATAPRQLSGAGPNASASVNDQTQIPLTVYNACNDDVLTGTGEMHTVLGSTTDSAGGQHQNAKTQLSNIKLTGASGASYVGSSEVSNISNLSAGATFTMVENFKLIGQGQTPNQVGQVHIHTTVNANGDVTASVSDFSVDCR